MPSSGFLKTFILSFVLFFCLILFLSTSLSSLTRFGSCRHPRNQAPSPSSKHGNDSKAQDFFQGDGLRLRHVFHHGAGQPGPRARRLDVTSDKATRADVASGFGPFIIKTTSISIDKPTTWNFDSQAPISPYYLTKDVEGPDITHKDTVVNLAWMSEDAYKPDRSDPEWVDIGEEFNHSIPFGWDDSGIRGHVFSDANNSSVILSVKGTTVAVFEGNGTSTHDKENDNLFGSCCCGQGGSYLWRTVCDCQTGTYTCDEKCVKEELNDKSRYYTATLELYDEVVKLYPNANIITVGHSLGGVLASLIGLRHGIPSVTFEAYPQALAAARLGLPIAEALSPLRRNTGGFHFGHTADPVYMGTCNGASSFCSIAGYAFETLCHTGKRCVYDVVKDWGWRQSTNTHRLRYAIANVYEKYDEAAPCENEEVDCVDCYLWKFQNGTHTKPATTTAAISTTSSRTRTETCKTPGWWGCRDATTTIESTITSTATTTASTSTCETPGWFGCKDKTTSATSATTSTSTSTCKTPGWFGCNDKTTTTTTSVSSSNQATTTSCSSKGWFGRCLDQTPTVSPTSAEAAYWRTVATATQTPS